MSDLRNVCVGFGIALLSVLGSLLFAGIAVFAAIWFEPPIDEFHRGPFELEEGDVAGAVSGMYYALFAGMAALLALPYSIWLSMKLASRWKRENLMAGEAHE